MITHLTGRNYEETCEARKRGAPTGRAAAEPDVRGRRQTPGRRGQTSARKPTEFSKARTAALPCRKTHANSHRLGGVPVSPVRDHTKNRLLLSIRQLVATVDCTRYGEQLLGIVGNPQLGKLLVNITPVELPSRRHDHDDVRHNADARTVDPRVLPSVGDCVDELVLGGGEGGEDLAGRGT